MKSPLLFVALMCAVTLSSASLFTTNAKPAKQRATTTFNEPVTIKGVLLKPGEYLFVHDDAAMMRGEACTFVYQGNSENAAKLLVSFHCTPAQRAKVASFTMRMERVAGVNELREFQFSGDLEAHTVPGL